MTSRRAGFLVAAALALLVASGLEGANPAPTRRLRSVGSDTMNSLMTRWGETFMRSHPEVSFMVSGKGSATGPAALITAACELAPMSRLMTEDERRTFARVFGYPVTEIPVAIDTLAVYVHKSNPIQGLTMAQVDAIFSSTRHLGAPELMWWGQLGLTGDWAKWRIAPCGRNRASGTHEYFRAVALENGAYKEAVHELPGSAAVVAHVAEHPAAIGYSGIGYRTDGARVVPLARDDESPFISPDDTAKDYPLQRFLYICINRQPGQAIDPLLAAFLDHVLSDKGQQIVTQEGYIPLPPTRLAESRRLVGLPSAQPPDAPTSTKD